LGTLRDAQLVSFPTVKSAPERIVPKDAIAVLAIAAQVFDAVSVADKGTPLDYRSRTGKDG
jgi:hypothetical protein